MLLLRKIDRFRYFDESWLDLGKVRRAHAATLTMDETGVREVNLQRLNTPKVRDNEVLTHSLL